MELTLEILTSIMEEFIPMQKFMGIKVQEVKPNYIRMEVPFKPEMVGDPRNGRLHGGIMAMAMDACGGGAAFTTLKTLDDKISTVDIRIDYLRPAWSEVFLIESEVIRSGNRIVVCQMAAWHPSKGKEELLAVGKGVFSVKRQNQGED